MRPAIESVLETCLYCNDLVAAERFYGGVLGLELYSRREGRQVFFRCGQGMLLIFDPSATSAKTIEVGGAEIPRHGARGPGHAAFLVEPSAIESWRRRFAEVGVEIESEVEWPAGGRSLYFRDPAGNSLELATASVW